jgi:uncharacterized protein YaiL (DUF2058 family)
MANSLRDQLLKAGLVEKAAEPRRKVRDKRRKRNKHAERPAAATAAEPDLAQAYAIRAKAEAGERRREKAEAERETKLRKERKLKLQQTLQGAALNKPDADVARHFEYGGKIRRIYVDAEQLSRLNAGALAVVQQAGRYVLVTAEVAGKVRAFASDNIALWVESGGKDDEDDGVPDDLVW